MHRNLRRRDFLALWAAATTGSVVGAPSARPLDNPGDPMSATSRPNILYIMADDHTCQAIGAYATLLKAHVRTPHIDRLAREGVRLDNCFCVNSICVPSRATILTGEYSHRNGVYTLNDAIDPNRPHIAHWMGAAGYQTALIGKWHLQSQPAGFDYWDVLPGQGVYFDPVMTAKDKGRRRLKGYSTDVITDRSLEWLQARDRTKPFFLMTHFKNSHAPWQYPKRNEPLYDGVTFPEPPSLFEDLSHRSDGSREYGFRVEGIHLQRMTAPNYPTGPLNVEGLSPKEQIRACYQKYLRDYLRCVAAIDENVGRLLDYLDTEGLAENTVVVYTSDQGLYLGEHGYIDKRWMYEESLRMPFLARYPREIPAGSVRKDLILNTDFAPTFLSYGGVSALPASIQGRNARHLLAGLCDVKWRQSMYYRYWMHCSRPAHYGVRTRQHKLIFFYGLPLGMKGAEKQTSKPGWELYDLEKDPQELKNVFREPAYKKIAEDLKAELLRLKDELGDSDDRTPEVAALREATWKPSEPS